MKVIAFKTEFKTKGLMMKCDLAVSFGFSHHAITLLFFAC